MRRRGRKPRAVQDATPSANDDNTDLQKAEWAQFLRRNEPAVLAPSSIIAPKSENGLFRLRASAAAALSTGIASDASSAIGAATASAGTSSLLPLPFVAAGADVTLADGLPTPDFETVPSRKAAARRGMLGQGQAVFLQHLQQREIGPSVGTSSCAAADAPSVASSSTRHPADSTSDHASCVATATTVAAVGEAADATGDAAEPVPQQAHEQEGTAKSDSPAAGGGIAATASIAERSYFIITGLAGHARVKLKLPTDTPLTSLFTYFFTKVDAPAIVQQHSMFLWNGAILDGSKTPLDYGMGTSLQHVNTVRIVPRKHPVAGTEMPASGAISAACDVAQALSATTVTASTTVTTAAPPSSGIGANLTVITYNMSIAGDFSAVLANATATARLSAQLEVDLTAKIGTSCVVKQLLSGSLIVNFHAFVPRDNAAALVATKAAAAAIAVDPNRAWLAKSAAIIRSSGGPASFGSVPSVSKWEPIDVASLLWIGAALSVVLGVWLS